MNDAPEFNPLEHRLVFIDKVNAKRKLDALEVITGEPWVAWTYSRYIILTPATAGVSSFIKPYGEHNVFTLTDHRLGASEIVEY